MNKTKAELLTQLKYAQTRIANLEAASQWEKSNLLHQVLTQIKDVIWIASLDGTIVFDVNPAFEALYGYQIDTFKANPNLWLDVVHPDDQALAKSSMQNLAKTGRTEVVYRILRPDGSMRWILDRKSLLYNEQGIAVRLGGVASDITEHRLAEEKLHLSEEQYRLLFENTSNGILFTDPNDGRIFSANPAACRIWGGTEADLCKLGRDGIVDLNDERLQTVVAERASAGQFTGELNFRHANGTVFPVELTSTIFETADGHRVASIFFTDVTERKQAEKRLRSMLEISQTLTQSLDTHTILQQIIDNITQVMGLDSGVIYTLTDEKLYLEATVPPLPPNFPDEFRHANLAEHPHIQTALARCAPVIIPDTMTADLTEAERAVSSARGLRSIAYLPLMIAQKAIGVLIVASTTAVRTFTAEELQLYQGFSGQAAQAIENVHLYATTKSHAAELEKQITERKQAEENLSKSEEQYRFLLDNTSDFIARYDVNGRMLFGTDAALRFNGYRQNELVNTSAWDRIHPDDLDNVRNILETVIRTGQEGRAEYRVRHKNGEYIWVEASGRRVLNLAGKPEIIVVQRNITERKQAEEKLQESERLYRNAMEVAGAVPYYQSYSGKIPTVTYEFIGEGIRQITGYGPMEFNATVWDSLVEKAIPVEELEGYSLDEAAQRTRAGEFPIWKCEFQIRDRAGKTHWVFEAAVELRDADGQPVGSIGSYQDITTRKQAEEKLRESEERFRTVADFTYDWEYWLDENQRFLYISPTCERVTGYTREEFLRDPELLQRILHPVDRQLYENHMREEFDLDEGKDLDFRIITAKGETRWIAHTCREVVDQYGRRQGRRVSNRDITERKRSEEKLRESEMRYRVLFDNSPVSLWEEDFSAVKLKLDELRRSGVTDFHQYFTEHPETMLECATLVKVLDVNKTTLNLLGATHKDELLQTLEKNLRDDAIQGFEQELVNIASGKTMFEWEGRNYKATGELIDVHLGWSAAPGHEADLAKVLISITDITQRKQTEQQLRASQENYRGLLESLNSVVATVNSEGRFLYMNDTAAEQLGGNPGQFIGRTMYELFPDQVAQEQMADVLTVITSDHGKTFENLSFVKGQARWYRTSIQPLHAENGQVEAVLLNSTDIHDLKIMQQQLHELNQSLEEKVEQRTAEAQDLYDKAPVGYYSTNNERQITAINQTELIMLGYARNELLGQSDAILFTPESATILQDKYQRLMAQGSVTDMEITAVRKDGSTFPAMINATAVYDEAGNFISSRSTLTDISIRKQAEDAVRENLKRVRALYEVNQGAIESSDLRTLLSLVANTLVNVLSCDRVNILYMDVPNRRIEFACKSGPGAANIAEITFEEAWAGLSGWALRERQIAWSPDGSPDDRESHAVQARRQGTHAGDIVVVPLFYQEHPLGTITLINQPGTKSFNADDLDLAQAIANQAAIAIERIRAENKIRQANMELEKAMRVKDEFLANMSHELRTPLNAIIGLSESLLENTVGELNARQQKYTGTIHESGQHLLTLINDILDLAKIGAGQVTLEPSRVDVHAACESSLRMVRQLSHKKGLQVQFDIDADIDFITADERRLKQMLVNLLSNAVKFTPATGQVGLEVRGDRTNQSMQFTVWDTGIGISREDQTRLFQPFVQVNPALTRETGGTGLGLALVAQMVQMHGGSVGLESEPGQGSRFYFILPWHKDTPLQTDNQQPVLQVSETESHPTPKTGTQTILLVEDTETSIMTIRQYLEHIGYRVEVARNGRDGLKAARQFKPDLILMDVQMPMMDGLETIRKLRTEAEFQKTPIIALTAFAMSGDRERCMAAGATDYMSKPVKLKELVTVIEQLLK